MEPKKDLSHEAQNIIHDYIHKLRMKNTAMIYRAYNYLYKNKKQHISRTKFNQKLNKLLNSILLILLVTLLSLVLYHFDM